MTDDAETARIIALHDAQSPDASIIKLLDGLPVAKLLATLAAIINRYHNGIVLTVDREDDPFRIIQIANVSHNKPGDQKVIIWIDPHVKLDDEWGDYE